MPRLTGHWQPRRNWPTLSSNILITHPILRIWPRYTTTCSLDWKKQLKVRHFSSDAEVIAAAETWLDGQHSEFFFELLAKGRAADQEFYWASWGCFEKIPSLVAVDFSFLVRLRTYQHPLVLASVFCSFLHKNPSPFRKLNQTNPVHVHPFHFSVGLFNIILKCKHRCAKWTLSHEHTYRVHVCDNFSKNLKLKTLWSLISHTL